MHRRFQGPPTAVIVMVVAAVQVMGTVFAAARQAGHEPLGVPAFVLLLAGPAALSLRRRAPLLMLALAVAATGAYLALGYPLGPVFVSLGLAIVFSSAAGKRWQTWLVVGVCAAAVVLYSLARGDEAALVRAFAATSWLAILVLFGEGIRLRSERVAERRRQHQAREQAARDEYRLTLARDIHDVVAHSLSMINVQASVALHLGGKDPERYRPALEAIKAASKESLAEVRQLLGVLRDDAPLRPAAAPGLSRIPELVDSARQAGLEVRADVSTGQLTDPVQQAAYRIVQEALTNVVRHSGARQAAVVISTEADRLTITVDDDGDGAGGGAVAVAAGIPGGNGITGMRERAAALGGTLELASLEPGWRVRAVIPLPSPGAADVPAAEEQR